VEGTFTFNDNEDPLTSVSPANVEVVVVAPQEDTETEVGVGASRCDEGGSVQLGATGVIPFWWADDSGMGFFVVASPSAPVASFDSSKGEGAALV
jgi:hypothetical protein